MINALHNLRDSHVVNTSSPDSTSVVHSGEIQSLNERDEKDNILNSYCIQDKMIEVIL